MKATRGVFIINTALLCLVSVVLFMPWKLTFAQQSPRRPGGIRILFLGDQGHHRPADRFAQLEPTLANAGIRSAYTEALTDLNPDRLAGYDCIVIYANHTKISADQEKALLDFV